MLRPLQSEDIWQHRDATVLSLQRESLYLEIRSLYWKRDLVINSNGNMGVTYILNALELACSNLKIGIIWCYPWWRHQMETSSALLALCAGNSPVPGEFPTQRPVTRGFDVFFDLRPNKRLSKQSWGWWFETLSCSLWRHCNENQKQYQWFVWVGDMCYIDRRVNQGTHCWFD